MTLAGVWKQLMGRIRSGERDEDQLVADGVIAIEKDKAIRLDFIEQGVRKRVRDMIAAEVKPTGATSRVPAGQGDFGWFALTPVFALERLRRQVKGAYGAMSRARRHAELLGIIDSSGLTASNYETLGDLCRAANVPEDLMEAFAGEEAA